MNGYERALRTLRFEETDCVPTFGGWVVSADFFEYVTGKSFWEDPLSIACEAYRTLEADMVFERPYLPVSPEEWRAEVMNEELKEQKDFRSPEDVCAYVRSLPEPKTLAQDFDFDAELENVRREYEGLQKKLGPECLCLPFMFNCRFTWFTKFGYESFLMALALEPDTMAMLFSFSAEEARLKNAVRAELVRRGIMPPFFYTGSDICGNRGPIVSPDLLRSIYFPALQYALEPLVDLDADIIWHSDGYIVPILDDLIRCGASGFQGFQEQTGFNIGEIARRQVRAGRKPILLAGVPVDTVLPFGSVEDVKREIDRIIQDAGAGGGLVIGTANTAGPDCPNENLETLFTYPHTRAAHKL
jgi:hypothetical protein